MVSSVAPGSRPQTVAVRKPVIIRVSKRSGAWASPAPLAKANTTTVIRTRTDVIVVPPGRRPNRLVVLQAALENLQSSPSALLWSRRRRHRRLVNDAAGTLRGFVRCSDSLG